MNSFSKTIKDSLTTEQKRFVRTYHKSKTVKEMADKFKVPTSRLYSFLRTEKIDFIKTQSARHGTDKRFASDMFNPYEHSNWIV
jgi:hypothetical protein